MAGALGVDRGGIVSAAVVLDAHEEPSVLRLERHRNRGGVGVLSDVDERLLGYPVESHPGLRWGLVDEPVVEACLDPGLLVHRLQVRAQGRGQAALVERSGAKLEDQVPESGDRGSDRFL